MNENENREAMSSDPPLYWNVQYSADCVRDGLDRLLEAIQRAPRHNAVTNAVALTRLIDFDNQLDQLVRSLGGRPWEQFPLSEIGDNE